MKTTVRGVIHGKMIELEQAPGLPDGQQVGVTIEPLPIAGPAPLPPGEGLRRAFGARSATALAPFLAEFPCDLPVDRMRACLRSAEPLSLIPRHGCTTARTSRC